MVSITAQVTKTYRRQWKTEAVEKVEYRHLTDEEEGRIRERHLLREGIWLLDFNLTWKLVVEPRVWDPPNIYDHEGVINSVTLYPKGWGEMTEAVRIERKRGRVKIASIKNPLVENDPAIDYSNTPEATAERIRKARERLLERMRENGEEIPDAWLPK